MTHYGFLTPAFVATILAGVALLGILSTLILAPLDRRGRRHIVAFWICVVAIWVGAVCIIVLVKRSA